MRIDPYPSGRALIPAPNPQRSAVGYRKDTDTYIATPGGGTGHDTGVILTTRIGAWHARFNRWRSGFEQGPGPDARQYWALYRAFDSGPLPGPNQDWRDRTVIPTCFKVIENRVPKIILGLWGQPETFAVEGRGFRDETYEDKVRTVIQTHLDEIGKGQAQSEPLPKRLIDAERYKQIVGHVWYKVWWRQNHNWIKTKIPRLDPETGKQTGWDPIESMQLEYDGVEINWLALDSLAVDLGGIGPSRRWAIERVQTSVEALKHENRVYKKRYGVDLYKNMALLDAGVPGGAPIAQRESYEEPRDTEHWPLTDDQITDDPGETKIELWLCWDNQERTLTKIANRNVEIAHGLAPTPDGLDPYIGVPAVPVPGRVYGDSMLHWVGPLVRYQTRIARARADEVLLGIWQQYIYRQGALRNTQWFWRPGGGMGVEQADPTRPISDVVQLLPRKPVFQEAYAEDSYRQTQAESAAAADAVSQGAEATTKSRDVSATEINQRVLQGAGRHQLEILYNEYTLKKPMLQKVFDLIQMNMTQEKAMAIGDDSEDGPLLPVDLQQLRRPIDIVVGGGIREATQQEKVNELREIKDLGDSPNYGPYMKHGEIAKELLKSTRTLAKTSTRFVRTEEEVMKRAQAQAAAMAAQQPTQGGNGATGPSTPATAPAQGQTGGSPGPGGLNGPTGASPETPPAASESSSFEI